VLIDGKVIINIPKTGESGLTGGMKMKGVNSRRAKFITDYEEYITLNTLSHGTSFGEIALISNKPRSANAVAVEDCHLATISKEIFNLCI